MSGPARFPTTRWTLIREAQSAEDRAQLLRHLLGTYWWPLYHLARRRGASPDAAEDAVQSFAVELMERSLETRLDRDAGRLRGYLRRCFDNHVQREHAKGAAAKRGGGERPLSIDQAAAEAWLQSAGQDPELAYERSWAQAVMNEAYRVLKDELLEAGKGVAQLELLEAYFASDTLPPYTEIAAAWGGTPSQVKSFLHRARARFRQLLLERVADTVEPGEAEAELERLFAVLRRDPGAFEARP